MLLPIWGSKGVGKTALALELSKKLTADGKSVLLISPEPYSELSAILGVNIPQEKSLQAAIRSGNITLCAFHKDDLFYLLAAPGQHDIFDDNYSAKQVQTMLELSKSTFDVVLADCPSEMNNLVSAWALSLGEAVLFCMGGGFEGAMWQRASERAIQAIRRKTIFVGMETSDAFDYEAMYDFLQQKPHHRVPKQKSKNYEKAISKLKEVIEN